ALQAAAPEVYAEYKAEAPSSFLVFAPSTGLDGKKLGDVATKFQEAQKETPGNPEAALQKLSESERAVYQASIAGDRKTLVADSVIPGTMALIYLGILFYFKSIGGYRPVHIASERVEGTVEAPVR